MKTKITARANRWLLNYCELSTRTIMEDDQLVDEVYVPKVVSTRTTDLKNKAGKVIKSNVILRTFKMKDVDTTISEFIMGYKYNNGRLTVYTALRFDNETKSKVFCSLWGYKPSVVQKENIN